MTEPACRSCGSPDGTRLVPVLDLGVTPLANRLLSADQLADAEPTFPLSLRFCPLCSLLQITETVPPDVLFRDYVYFSSYSETMLRHASASAARLIDDRQLDRHSFVVEAASNDGYMLRNFVARDIPVLGVEPAANVAAVARRNGVPTLDAFFGVELAERLVAEGRAADLFLANNVLAHVADLNGFVRGVKTLLKERGRAVIEMPYARDMIDQVEFDTIYHEHLCYFSLSALQRLFGRHGLELADVQRLPLHGGTLRITATHTGAVRPSAAVDDLLAEEQRWGMDRADFYLDFGRRVETLRHSLVRYLAERKEANRRIAAYGASAKGSTLLNYCGIGRETIDFVVDRSPHKQGRYTPGTHLPIHAPERLLEQMPDEVLLLTWNLADEILAQQAEYRRRGGRFLIPIPNLRVA
jgi:SAM-dependent methyltransferase